MLQPTVDCVLIPEVDCFFESEPMSCEDPVVDLGELFESPDFSAFLSLLDTTINDAPADATVTLSGEGSAEAEAFPACSAAHSQHTDVLHDTTHGHPSFTSAGSATFPQHSTPSSSGDDFVSCSRDSHTATSTVKLELQPAVSTGPEDTNGQLPQPSSAKCSTPEVSSQCDEQSSQDIGMQDINRSNKRKLPDIDWRSIEDPEERRRQRRLAKNRVTAARSRERKKVQWSDMQSKMDTVEDENMRLKSMLEKYLKENSALKEQLASVTRRASTAACNGGKEPAALHIAISLLFCHQLHASETFPQPLCFLSDCCSIRNALRNLVRRCFAPTSSRSLHDHLHPRVSSRAMLVTCFPGLPCCQLKCGAFLFTWSFTMATLTNAVCARSITHAECIIRLCGAQLAYSAWQAVNIGEK